MYGLVRRHPRVEQIYAFTTMEADGEGWDS